MRIAVLSDIHSNLPALEAVLKDLEKEHVEQIMVGGDTFPGPMPRETIQRLLSLKLPVQFIHGNGDREVLERMKGNETNVPEEVREILRWTADQLHPKYDSLVASWPLTRQINVPGIGRVLFCHATPNTDTQVFSKLTLEEKLRPIFDPLNVSLVVVAHTHMQYDRMVGKTRVINAGSVGGPYGRTGADWAILGPNVQHKHTEYDLQKAAERIRSTEYPGKEGFIRNMLNPLSEREVLAILSRDDLKEATALKKEED